MPLQSESGDFVHEQCTGHACFSIQDKGRRMPLWMDRSLCDLGLRQRFKDSCLRGRIAQIVQIDKMFNSGFGL